MSFEGFAECRLRFITDAQRRLADREILFREQSRRLPHPPTREVSEWRLAHQGADDYSHFRSPSTQDDQTKNQASTTFTTPLSPVILGACQSNATRTTGNEYTCGASQCPDLRVDGDRKSTRLNSSHLGISYAVFC